MWQNKHALAEVFGIRSRKLRWVVFHLLSEQIKAILFCFGELLAEGPGQHLTSRPIAAAIMGLLVHLQASRDS